MSNHHDKLFKSVFSDPEAAATELRALLPPELLATLDLGSLTLQPGSFVDEELRELHTDLLFSAQAAGRETLVYLLFEHRSSPDPLLPFRLLRYVVNVWASWLTEHKDEHPKRLPPVLPLVVYHGASEWTAATELLELIDLPQELLPVVERHLPRFEFVLDDLTKPQDEELRARAGSALAVSALLLMKKLSLGQDPRLVLRQVADLLGKVRAGPDGARGFFLLVRYALLVTEVEREEAAQIFADELGPDAAEDVMTTGEKLLAEGELRGRRQLLLRQLHVKFGRNLPANVLTQVEAGTVAELDLWAERVLTEAEIEKVFAPESASS